jgi:hypothetical protein
VTFGAQYIAEIGEERMDKIDREIITAEIIDFEIDGDILVVSFWLIVNGAKQDIWELTLIVEECTEEDKCN